MKNKIFDYKIKQLFSSDEYFMFENYNDFEVVHCEDFKEYFSVIEIYFQTYYESGEYVIEFNSI